MGGLGLSSCLRGGSEKGRGPKGWAKKGRTSERPPDAGGAEPHGSSAGAKKPPPASEPPPPPKPPPDEPRVVRFTLAVAYFNDGPISSTSNSTTVRFSPSRVS